MFIVSLNYTADLDCIDGHLADHIRYLDEHYALGHFVLSGRKMPRTGGVILSTLTDRNELEAVLAQDPFIQHHLATYDVIEMVPSKASAELEHLIEAR